MKKLLIPLVISLFLAASCAPSKNDDSKLPDNENTENEISVSGEDNRQQENSGSAVTPPDSDSGSKSEDVSKPENNSNEGSGDNKNNSTPPAVSDDTPLNSIAAEFPDDRWIIKPSYVFDSLETFGMSGYSIYIKDSQYGILDMTASGIGTGDYSELFYCPTHGLSCPDIADTPIKMREDLYLAPDCGYEYTPESEVTYVFDPTRDRVYATGYSEGYFKIVDITDTEFYTTNERYTIVLYDCDADLMMYEDIGMPSLESVFAAESKEMHYGVIDRDMDYVIAAIYDEIRDGNDCYIVKQNGKYGYRALTGKEYYPCVFQQANTAYKGAAWVKYEGKWGTVRF